MNYAEIIHDAWRLTVNTGKLKWLCFCSSFAAVIFFVAEILWQAGLLSEELGIIEHSYVYSKIGDGFKFLMHNNLLGWALFLGIFVLLFQFALPSWILSSLILGIKRKFTFPEKYLSVRQIITDGFQYFPKLVELHAIFSPFSFMTITFFSMTLYRYYHGEFYSHVFIPAIIVFACFSLIVNVFTVFCPFFIILEDSPVMLSIKKSIGLVFINLEVTLSVILIMMLVNIRVIINVIVVLGVPMGLFFALSFFAKSAWFGFAIVTVSIIGIGLLALSAYLTAIIEVFSNAVWVRSYEILRAKQEADKKELENASEMSHETSSEMES
jgi:hypothetical protein